MYEPSVDRLQHWTIKAILKNLREWKRYADYTDELTIEEINRYKLFLKCFKRISPVHQRVLYVCYYKYVEVVINQNLEKRVVKIKKRDDILNLEEITAENVKKARFQLHMAIWQEIKDKQIDELEGVYIRRIRLEF